MCYSIIIPVYNEEEKLHILLPALERFHNSGHEIVIVNDGSNDQSHNIFLNYNFIKLVNLEKNQGKGVAIKTGLSTALNDKIIIYDGDLELDTNDIEKLMKLNKKKGVIGVLGTRYKKITPFLAKFDWGNLIFTSLFNFIFQTKHKDILCCAKAFYKSDMPLNKIMSNKFDIDVELCAMMTIYSNQKYIPQINLNYTRRTIKEGKKLRLIDGWLILIRILKIRIFREFYTI